MKRIEFSKLQIKQDMDKILVLHFGQFGFFLLALLIELMTFSNKSWVVIKVIVAAGMSIMFYRTLKNLYYSFWTFAVLFSVYYLTGFLGAFGGEGTFSLMNCYLFALSLLVIEMYLLYSPIFYPVVRWWEYDFRYRHDLKAIITKDKDQDQEKQEQLIGRLTDVRRNAGCIQLFENLQITDLVTINASLDDQTTKVLRGEVISKRQYSVGRPWNYGIKMRFENSDEQRDYKELELNWKSDIQDKIRKKFEKPKKKESDEQTESPSI